MHTEHVSGRPAAFIAMLLAFAFSAHAQQPRGPDDDWSQAVQDAWIAGKLESAYLLNEHLNPFDIDIDVNHGVVELSGSVESDIQKELAGTIAQGIGEVEDVENNLSVNPGSGEPQAGRGENGDGSRGFGQWVDDATTTAVIKTRLAANEHIHSLDVDVDTRNGLVTLSGKVESPEARTLAGVIASNSRNVRRVENELVVE